VLSQGLGQRLKDKNSGCVLKSMVRIISLLKHDFDGSFVVFILLGKTGALPYKTPVPGPQTVVHPFNVPCQIFSRPVVFFLENMGKCFPLIRAKLINLDVFEQLVQFFDRCGVPFANHVGQHPARFGGISMDQPAFPLFFVPNTTPVPIN